MANKTGYSSSVKWYREDSILAESQAAGKILATSVIFVEYDSIRPTCDFHVKSRQADDTLLERPLRTSP